MANESSGDGALSEIQGVGWIKIHEGKLEEFKRLSVQCMEIARTKDTGTLQYEVYLSDDQLTGGPVHLFTRFVSVRRCLSINTRNRSAAWAVAWQGEPLLHHR
jgi:hypothetical protein